MKAILFDFDGVIVKSMEDHYQGWKLTLQEYGIEMQPEELFMMEGQGVMVLAHQFSKKYNLPGDVAADLVEKKQAYYNKIKKIQFYPNLLDVLKWASEKELKMAIVSGGQRDRITQTVDDFGLLEYFSAIVSSDDVSKTKPHPEPYLQAANMLKVEPADCIVVENAPLGILSGKSAQMKVIALTTTLTPQHLKEADIVVDNFVGLLDVLNEFIRE